MAFQVHFIKMTYTVSHNLIANQKVGKCIEIVSAKKLLHLILTILAIIGYYFFFLITKYCYST